MKDSANSSNCCSGVTKPGQQACAVEDDVIDKVLRSDIAAVCFAA